VFSNLRGRVLNVALRAVSLLSRFLLLFALAFYFSVDEVGYFGLFFATIAFYVILMGGEFYIYAQRTLYKYNKDLTGWVVISQLKVYGLIYLIFGFIVVIPFGFDFLKYEHLVIFFLLVVFEHLSQEISRFLIVTHRQIVASIVFFIRAGLWVLILVPLMFFYPDIRSLEIIFSVWLVAAILSVLFGSFYVLKNLSFSNEYHSFWVWARRGLFVGFLFLISALSIKGFFTFDRYLLATYTDMSRVGAYVFYISIVASAFNFLEPAIFSFSYPRMLQYYNEGRMLEFKSSYKNLKILTFSLALCISIMLYLFTPYLIDFLGDDNYVQNYGDFPIIILAGAFYAVSYIPHYKLVVYSKDRFTTLSSSISLAVFFLAAILLDTIDSFERISLALLTGFIFLYLSKTIYLYKIERTL